MANKHIALTALGLFALNFILFFPLFSPQAQDISNDESFYLRNGSLFSAGTPTALAWSPLSSIIYAPFYRWFGRDPAQVARIGGIGRAILFCLLWLAAFWGAYEMRLMVSPCVTLALSFMSPAFQILILKTSDGLFAALNGLALWQVLGFYAGRKTIHLLMASLFLGLSALTRSEGFFLGLVLMLLGLALSGRGEPCPKKRILRKLFAGLAAALPFFVMVGGSAVWYRAAEGRWEWGAAQRTYSAFEYAQGIFSSDPEVRKNPFREGPLIARRLYGTPQENQLSLWNAACRNPAAFWKHFTRIVREVPRTMVSGLGGRFGVLFLALAGLGGWALIRQKQFGLLGIIFSWTAYFPAYFLVSIRPNYFTYAYFPLLVLASVGVSRAIRWPEMILKNRYREFIKPAVTLCAVILAVTSFALRRPFPISNSKDTYGFFTSDTLSRK